MKCSLIGNMNVHSGGKKISISKLLFQIIFGIIVGLLVVVAGILFYNNITNKKNGDIIDFTNEDDSIDIEKNQNEKHFYDELVDKYGSDYGVVSDVELSNNKIIIKTNSNEFYNLYGDNLIIKLRTYFDEYYEEKEISISDINVNDRIKINFELVLNISGFFALLRMTQNRRGRLFYQIIY